MEGNEDGGNRAAHRMLFRKDARPGVDVGTVVGIGVELGVGFGVGLGIVTALGVGVVVD